MNDIGKTVFLIIINFLSLMHTLDEIEVVEIHVLVIYYLLLSNSAV